MQEEVCEDFLDIMNKDYLRELQLLRENIVTEVAGSESTSEQSALQDLKGFYLYLSYFASTMS